MVRKALAILIALGTVLNLTIFSIAAPVVDSGTDKHMYSASASSSRALDMAVAAAAESGVPYGYNIEPYPWEWSIFNTSTSYPNAAAAISTQSLPSGLYRVTVVFDRSIVSAYNPNVGSGNVVYSSFSDNVLTLILNFTSDLVWTNTNSYGFGGIASVGRPEIVDVTVQKFTPVEGISCGYTYFYETEAFQMTYLSKTVDFDFSFGSQPAGSYIFNIYHHGSSYDINFFISPSNALDCQIPVINSSGCSTFVYDHGGGDLSFTGSFNWFWNHDFYYYESGISTTYQSIDVYIDDIIAYPINSASPVQFGFFAPIVAFLRDCFADVKSFIGSKIDDLGDLIESLFSDPEAEEDVDNASDSLQQEIDEVAGLSGELSENTANLEQQFSTDFAIPDELNSNSSGFQLIYTGLFSSLGIFSIFIWLPVLMAVIKHLLRL